MSPSPDDVVIATITTTIAVPLWLAEALGKPPADQTPRPHKRRAAFMWGPGPTAPRQQERASMANGDDRPMLRSGQALPFRIGVTNEETGQQEPYANTQAEFNLSDTNLARIEGPDENGDGFLVATEDTNVRGVLAIEARVFWPDTGERMSLVAAVAINPEDRVAMLTFGPVETRSAPAGGEEVAGPSPGTDEGAADTGAAGGDATTGAGTDLS